MKRAAPESSARRPWALLLLLVVPAGALVWASVATTDENPQLAEAPSPASTAPLARTSEEPSAQPSAAPPPGLARCCTVLAENQLAAPPVHAKLYGMMADACNAYKEQGMPYSKASALLRKAAGPERLPAACSDLEMDGW